jgi:hypothetical protein
MGPVEVLVSALETTVVVGEMLNYKPCQDQLHSFDNKGMQEEASKRLGK